jgi:hypothetical protein
MNKIISKLIAITSSLVILFSMLTEISYASTASFLTDLSITSKLVAASKGTASDGKTPFTLTIQTKVINSSPNYPMVFDGLESTVYLSGGSGGAILTPASSGSVVANLTPTGGTVSGTDTTSPTSATVRTFNFTNALVTTIPANSFRQVEFNVTVEFTTGSFGTVNLMGGLKEGGSIWGGGPQLDQEADLSFVRTLTITVSPGGGVTANFGTNGLGYSCNDNNSAFISTCSINDTYYGKPYITFTAAPADDGFIFNGWGLDCIEAGTSSTCTKRITGDLQISALYSLAPIPTAITISANPAYFGDNLVLDGTNMDSADGWAIFFDGTNPGEQLQFKSTSFISQSVSSLTIQLPSLAQLNTYITTFYGDSRSATSSLSWTIYPYASFPTFDSYPDTGLNLVLSSKTSPSAPIISTAASTGSTSATVTFTAPASNGGAVITSYTATSSPGGLTGTLAGATAGTITISGLTASTAYTFTVTATNSEGTSTASSASNSITTSAIPPESGGPGPVSTTAADELRRQQDAAAAEKQRKDKELTETLALVPVIAGLAQELARFGDSILKPKKCVKGKSVKRVSSTAKCPKGFKVKR